MTSDDAVLAMGDAYRARFPHATTHAELAALAAMAPATLSNRMTGTSEEVKAYRVYSEDGVLRVRTSHDGAYRDTYVTYPLTSIRKWVTS